jgi:hypothetical protein
MSNRTIHILKVTEVLFDTDGDHKLAGKLRKKYMDTVWQVDEGDISEEEAQDFAMDAITEDSGFCILNINFEQQQ